MADEKENKLPLSKEEFATLLKASLPLNADRSQLHAFVRGQAKVIDQLFYILAGHANAILDIREKMIEHKEGIEHVANMVSDNEDMPQLVGFEEPKLIIPGV